MVARLFSYFPLFTIAAATALVACSPVNPRGLGTQRSLYADTITDDLALWHVEAEVGAQVSAVGGKLTVTSPGGATIWFKPELRSPVEISYKIIAIDEGGPYDRVSDLNQFWMASDPTGAGLFDGPRRRGGLFSEYDELELYYVGVGGHNNTRTRFRRYVGEKGNRPLLPEHDLTDPNFLIEGNRPYHVRIVSEGRRQRFYRDGELIFDITDDAPYLSGHFALRTVRNRLVLEDFIVRKLR